MTGFTKKSCFLLLMCVVFTTMVVFYHTRHTYWSTNRTGTVDAETIDVPAVYQKELQQNVIPMVKRWNSDRKTKLREVCDQIRSDNIPRFSKNWTASDQHIIVDRRHRLMYCPVPKAACTSWKVFFMNLRGVKVTADIHTQERTSVLHLSDLDPVERETVLKNYTKLIVVRHPFTRILSAYRNKLEPNGTFETTHLDHPKRFYWRQHVGKNILKRYRGKETAKYYLEHPDQYQLTFKEFVDFISTNKKSSISNNRHWVEMFEICYPCDIEYDFIAKFETLPEDSIYFLHSNGFSNDLTNHVHHATNSSSMKAVSQFYNELPVETIETLYQRYKYDFQLFDYDPRSFA